MFQNYQCHKINILLQNLNKYRKIITKRLLARYKIATSVSIEHRGHKITHVGFALADTTLLHFTETFCICVVIRASIRAVVFECPNALISLTMGAYLSEPVTKKEIGVDEDDNFWVSSASMQGWRVSQEVTI